MTGFGQAQAEEADYVCACEARSVNNRYLKIATRLPESLGALESRIEKTVKQKVRRGSVFVYLRLARQGASPAYRLNRQMLESYVEQLKEWFGDQPSILGQLVSLPGVVQESPRGEDAERDWLRIQPVLEAALANMDRMRREEGAAMYSEIEQCRTQISGLLEAIARRSPETVDVYRQRLTDRIGQVLQEQGLTVAPADLIREVSIFAERCDITEELARLRSHVAQFGEIAAAGQSAGRKLDFLAQEMYRESNTIGSKANDAQIAQLVVDLKSQVERIREIVQNVE